jgi:uncharacterized protein YdaU (DUF1376 family)
MTNAQPLDRRDLFRAVADTDLPMPVDVDTFDRPGHQWAQVRLEDNAAEQVDAWADAHDTTAEYGSVVPRSKSHGDFRCYSANITLAGWPVEVRSFVDEPETEREDPTISRDAETLIRADGAV